MAEDENPEGAAAGGEAPRQIQIQKIYLKDASFESPASPGIFGQENLNPKFELNIAARSQPAGDNLHEVVITVTVDARQDDKHVFVAEVQQAGLFTISGFNQEELEAMLGAFCPNQLYPFARERLMSLVSQGGFPPPQLHPVNFERIYAEERRRKKEEGAAGADAGNA